MHNNNTTPIHPENKEVPTWNPNRAYIQLNNNIVIDSCFPGGNIATANILSPSPLTIEIQGNTDVSLDITSKIRGFKKDKAVKFILKNANHLRKYVGQLRIKPYMVFKEEGEDTWQPLINPIQLNYTENAQIQGAFTFHADKYGREKKSNQSANDLHHLRDQKLTAATIQKEDRERSSYYFAMYYPYTYQDLSNFIFNLKMHHQINENPQNNTQQAYFNEQTITYSFERRKISLITITSAKNIESFHEKQPYISDQIFPHPKDRPFKLRNCPVVLLTARVHPSQTSSSYFIEGVIKFLLSQSKQSIILRQLFIFQIIPMLNPDGVEHGNFRFDHQLRNLNRYYGQASIDKTPSIRSAQILINYYRNRNNQQSKFTEFYQQTYCRLFVYADVHGHSSALPSFIYGNHTDKLQHMIQNKAFCKMLQQNFIPNGFSKIQSEFSKKNMTMQEKYDQFSKLCSGRVFAGKADSTDHQVFHSYTIEVLPYWQEFTRRKNDMKGDRVNAMDYARMLGKSFAITILDLLDINPQSKFNDMQLSKLRKQIQKQCINEQSRKLLTFKKIQSIQSSASQTTSKKILTEKVPAHLKEYVQRWFSNQIYVKHLVSKHELAKEPKVAAFFSKISHNQKYGFSQLIQSPRKIKQNTAKATTEPRQTIRTTTTNSLVPKDRVIFVCRKERGKVQGKINKQTLQLQNDFLDLLTHHKSKGSNKEIDFLTFKKESISRKEETLSTQRYEKELINKINREDKNIAFQIKSKDIVPKGKNNRIQTQTVILQTHNQSPSVIPRNFSKKEKQKSSVPNRQKGYPNPRPSFIEQFMLKIREERESTNVFLQKYDQQPKQKIMKGKSSIKQQIEQQQKKMLPILRRNKIFTINSQQKYLNPRCAFGRIYDSIVPSRKRAENEALIQQATLLHTKKVFISQKKEEIIRQQLKKSQKTSEYKN